MSSKGLKGAGSTSAVRWHLAAGRPVYYRMPDTPEGLLLKEYPGGRVELVEFNQEQDRVVKVLNRGAAPAPVNSWD